jgi:hypothetical protein
MVTTGKQLIINTEVKVNFIPKLTAEVFAMISADIVWDTTLAEHVIENPLG